MKHSINLILAIFLTCLFILPSSLADAQGVGINSSGSNPDPSAIIDANSTTKGALIPRMTTAQRDAIASPAEALMIFNLTTKCLEIYGNGVWQQIYCLCNPPAVPLAGTHTSAISQITWNWNTASGATGYKYNTANDYGTATDNGTGTTYTQTGLACNTAYTLYIWAYNSCGRTAVTTLTQNTAACPPPGPICGTQVWAPANLNVGTRINGGTNMSNNSMVEKYCYNNDEANCTIYGGLYQWGEIINYAAGVNCDPCGPTTGHGGVQGLCPTGYHIPSDLEWSRYEHCVENNISPAGTTSLATFQGNTGYRGSSATGVGPGDKMKVTPSNNPAWDGTNTSGFALLPSGYYYFGTGSFYDLGSRPHFWSATESGANSWFRNFESSTAQIRRDVADKPYGFSIRCLQD